MLFTDGNKIDLTLIPMDKKSEKIENDGFIIVLMDKDGNIPKFSEANDER